MKSMAEKVRGVWDGVYAGEEALVPRSAQTGIIAVDEALDWLCEGAQSVIDFGCGSGSMLFLCALRGTKRHTGIDFSPVGIRLARRRALLLGCGRYRFIAGGSEKLRGIGDALEDAAILSNIADNLPPADAQFVLAQIRRIVRPGGRVLIKLNPYLGPDQIREWNIRVISGDLLDDGLLLWNLPTEKWAALLRERFIIEGCTEAYYPEHAQTNRVFTLQVPPPAEG
jgi:Methylase involved in ubiquinone/menaquinone biosynthesis